MLAFDEPFLKAMMWGNFTILLALLFKFLRKPLGQFLKSRQEAERRLAKAHQFIEARHRDAGQTLSDHFLKSVADRQP